MIYVHSCIENAIFIEKTNKQIYFIQLNIVTIHSIRLNERNIKKKFHTFYKCFFFISFILTGRLESVHRCTYFINNQYRCILLKGRRKHQASIYLFSKNKEELRQHKFLIFFFFLKFVLFCKLYNIVSNESSFFLLFILFNILYCML